MTKQFDTVNQKVLEIAATHTFLKGLYGSKATVDQMNKVSGLGFSLIQRALQTSLIVRICALTEHPGSGKRQNLTVPTLLDSVDKAGEEKAATLRSKLEDVLKKMRKYRDNTIAHVDRSVALGEAIVEPVMVDDLEEALSTVYEAMNYIHIHHDRIESAYDHVSIGTGASAIVLALADSLRSKDLRDKAIAEQISPEAALELLKQRSDRNDDEILCQRID